LFYGPINQVLPPATATRWVETLLKIAQARETVVAIARRTGDASRDLAPATIEMIRRSVEDDPASGRLLAALEGEQPVGESEFSRIFGEELPGGLVFGDSEESGERTTDG
jgi:hypothetical protein